MFLTTLLLRPHHFAAAHHLLECELAPTHASLRACVSVCAALKTSGIHLPAKQRESVATRVIQLEELRHNVEAMQSASQALLSCTHRPTGRQIHRQTDRQTDRQTHTHTGTLTNRYPDRHRHTNTHAAARCNFCLLPLATSCPSLHSLPTPRIRPLCLSTVFCAASVGRDALLPTANVPTLPKQLAAMISPVNVGFSVSAE